MKPLEIIGLVAVIAIVGTIGFWIPYLINLGAWLFIWGDNMPESVYQILKSLFYFRYVTCVIGLVLGYFLGRKLQNVGVR